MDNCFPEPPLDPPESEVLCNCQYCGEPIFVGEEHWLFNDWHIHDEHWDVKTAKIVGAFRADGRE